LSYVESVARDSQEFQPELQAKFYAARKTAKENLIARGVKPRIGSIHTYWAELQRILREEYSISWYTPAEMNPGTMYD